jgi:hypothetical protein
MKCDDELMLMRIVKNSGMPVTKRSNLLVRHHGIHLGTFRDNRKESIQKRRNAAYSRIRPHARYWLGLIETPEYKSLFRGIQKQDEQAAWELKEAEKYAHQLGGKK